jgi:peptide/nickel transport system substrate-binding protein
VHASVITILLAKLPLSGYSVQPPPAGLWALPAEELKTLPGYSPDVEKNRAEARKMMEKLGYSPDKRLPVKVSTRDIVSE